MLRRTARKAAGSLPAAAVEDAVQEALLRAWRACAATGPPDRPAAWMTTIARREAARWSAGPHGRSWASVTAQPPERPAAGEDLAARIDVRRAVADLAPVDRALLALRYEADMTQTEIARLTGMPEGTVKVRLHRARKRLREHLS